jgi:hypothetical protein
MLSEREKISLGFALHNHPLPIEAQDFCRNQPLTFGHGLELEGWISAQLRIQNHDLVAQAIANCVKWGCQRDNQTNEAVYDFRARFREGHAIEALRLFGHIAGPGLIQLKTTGLPFIDCLTQISLVRMFLDPQNYVTLTNNVFVLRKQSAKTVLHDFVLNENKNTIPLTPHNEACYERWSVVCRRLVSIYYPDTAYRAVDMERAINELIRIDEADIAQKMILETESQEIST